jgi:hypothetical protein
MRKLRNDARVLSEKSIRMDGRHGRRWKGNIKMDIEDAGYETVDKIELVLEKVTKNQGHEKTHVGDRNTPNHVTNTIHEIHNSAKDRKQNTGNRSATTRYIILKGYLKLFIY